jgi:hypothetical protein
MGPTLGDMSQHVIGKTQVRVLVVAADDHFREEIGASLEAAGHEVLACPGPGPDDACVGARTGSCPLASGADAVVLDTVLLGDELNGGATGWQLALLYRDLGLALVALVEAGDEASLLRGEGATVVRRPASGRAVVRALERAVSEAHPA